MSQLAIGDFRFALIEDDMTSEVIRDLVVEVSTLRAGSVTSVGLSAPASVFSVSGTPVTGAGTLALSLATQTANRFWGGPAGGAAAVPTFRTLVAADLPAGTGTVTSVALALPGIFIVSGSPVNTAGTLTGTLATQAANAVWAGPASGAAAAPTFRALGVSDLPAALAAVIQGAPSFTVGAEVLNVIRVGVQLKDVAGNSVAFITGCNAWLSDAAGGVVSATVPGGVTIGTAGVIVYSPVASEFVFVTSNSAGFFDLDITYILAHTYYLNVEWQGRVYTSGAIAFA